MCRSQAALCRSPAEGADRATETQPIRGGEWAGPLAGTTASLAARLSENEKILTNMVNNKAYHVHEMMDAYAQS